MTLKGYKHFRRVKNLRDKIENDRNSSGCNRQFPECPDEPNDEDCINCPYYEGDKK